MFAFAQGFNLSRGPILVGGTLRCPLGSFGFRVGHERPHDPIRHPRPTATTEQMGFRLDARLKQEAQGGGTV